MRRCNLCAMKFTGGSGLAATVFVVVTACWVGLASLYFVKRDPSLGYMSDPEFGRLLVFLLLPGLGWLVAALMWANTWLARSSALTWIVSSICVPTILAMFWLPVSAVVEHI